MFRPLRLVPPCGNANRRFKQRKVGERHKPNCCLLSSSRAGCKLFAPVLEAREWKGRVLELNVRDTSCTEAAY